MTDIACPHCGLLFYNDWELIQHANGRHHYRAWTPEDGRRLALERESKGEGLFSAIRGARAA